MTAYIIPFEKLGLSDVGQVGGKNASLGEMIAALASAGVTVPPGFATTADAYREFLAVDGLDKRIKTELDKLDTDDVDALVTVGDRIRNWILQAKLPARLREEIAAGYEAMAVDGKPVSVAVRSSATAEDLPDASFAGQQETYLNVCGLEAVLESVLKVFASLFNDRAISYRVHHGYEHSEVALSAGIQKMARSDIGASGVIFTLDTESGFDEAVFITAAYGLGETIVQGAVNPDEFYVYKPGIRAGRPAILRRKRGQKAVKMIYDDGSGDSPVCTVDVDMADRTRFSISDDDVNELARLALAIEDHYKRPMDIEWARDGQDGKLYIVQARPETVSSRANSQVLERFTLKRTGKLLTQGSSIGHRIGEGPARVVRSPAEMNRVKPGDVLVTDMTDPDWEPIMKRAAAIVTNRGGRTCHAAIIARELGIPAVVGTNDATECIDDGSDVTVSCAEGDTGHVYAGLLDYEHTEVELDELPELPLKIMMNVGNPDRAFDFSRLPHDGIGLARLEFIINRMIGVHPKALIEFDKLDKGLAETVSQHMTGYSDPVSFFVQRLSEGISTIAAAFAPKPVIVRMSDFKSNEYANLIGGRRYEPHEENPMLGFRGASRYVDESFADCFRLECRALRYVREDMGLSNLEIMVPFVRTVAEARAVIDALAENGLRSGDNGLRIIMMCELPSNALLADQFLDLFDGFSIGSNDLTQLTLGLDRDSGLVAGAFDERNEAVKMLLEMAIKACRARGKYIGICGQGPSDHPDLAEWLMQHGIESISLNPDTVVQTRLSLAKVLA